MAIRTFRLTCFLLLTLLASCGGGDSSGDASATAPATPDVTKTVDGAGGQVTIADGITLTVPPNVLSGTSAVRIRKVVDPYLDAVADDGSDLFNVTTRSPYHFNISEVVPGVLAGGDLKVELRLPDDMAAQVAPGRLPAVLAWALDVSTDSEAGEALAAHELLDSTYDATTKVLTATLPSRFLSLTDPSSEVQLSTLSASLSIVIIDASRATGQGAQGNARPLAASPSTSFCGQQEWAAPTDDFRTVAAFAEARPKGPHGGLDIVTRSASNKPEEMHPVYAVGDGYVLKVKREKCDCPATGKSTCTAPKSGTAGYALTLKLNAGGQAAYRHLKVGQIELPGLKDEPNIQGCWVDTGKKYQVASGTLLARSGSSGTDAPHLHVEYSPQGDIDTLPAGLNRRNPLCKLVALSTDPAAVTFASADTDDKLVRMTLKDKTGKELTIRRSKALDIFLPALALPVAPQSSFESASSSVLAKVDRLVVDATIATRDDTWKDPSVTSLATDNANVALLKGTATGQTFLHLVPSIQWATNSAKTMALGIPIDVPVGASHPVLASGYDFTCGVRVSKGTVLCWGYNGFGQLGTGTIDTGNPQTAYPVPKAVPGITGAIALAAGQYHACAVISDGTVRCWGANFGGQLGDGTKNNSGLPVVVSGIADAVEVALGQNHSCALRKNGTVWCWGGNVYGSLGAGTTTNSLTPVQTINLVNAAAISSGNHTVCALRTTGVVSCWGTNNDGQLGNGTTASTSNPTTSPGNVLGIATAVAIGIDGYTGCAVLSDGAVKCWGDNGGGAVGTGSASPPVTTPVTVLNVASAVSVFPGNATCALLSDKSLSCWGGIGANLIPHSMYGSGGVSNVSIGSTGIKCIQQPAGNVQCWGGNGAPLGDGSLTTYSATPVNVLGFP